MWRPGKACGHVQTGWASYFLAYKKKDQPDLTCQIPKPINLTILNLLEYNCINHNSY